MNKTYVDKCMGDDCACHLATKREIKKISGMEIESISLTYEPSIFPGAGIMFVGPPGGPPPPTMAMAVRNIEELRERRRLAR